MPNLEINFPSHQPIIVQVKADAALVIVERYEALILEREDLHRQLTAKQEALDTANAEVNALRTALAELQASAITPGAGVGAMS